MPAIRVALPLLAVALLSTAAPAFAGGALTSGVTTSGSVAASSYAESWNFHGTSGERIVIAAVTTSGAMNTTCTLYPPSGPAQVLTSADRWDYQLNQTGTYILEVSDQGLNDAGTYALTYLNLTSGPLTHAGDLDGDGIASGEVRGGTIDGVADLDAFTFSGVAGQRVLFAALEGTGVPFNTNLTLYGPNGAGTEAGTSGGNRLDVQLASTGTYTVVVEDIGADTPGSYTVSCLNVTAGPLSTLSDPDGAAIASATTATGTMNGVVDWDAFTVTGNAGDRVIVTALTLSGTMNTTAYLYPPNGGAAQVATAADRWDFQLTQGGTHTLVIEDSNFGETGTYQVGYLNLTSGPLTYAGDLDGGAIASGEVLSGTIGGIGDLDAFTFSGVAGQRALFAAFEDTPVPFNTTLTLYGPNGAGIVGGTSGGNRLDVQLAATGTYTAVVEDIGDDTPGGYTVSHLNVTGGPHSTIADPDGGAITSATTATGTMNGVVDWDAFTITGNSGDRIIVTALTTSGAMNTNVYLYPPDGGSAQTATAADRWDFQLTQNGTWTLVMEDQAFGQTGTYQIGWLDVTSGPITEPGDLDGGPIASGEVRAGAIGGIADLDAFTFPGVAGQRVLFAALEGTGPPFNTNLTLYPPGGGASVGGTSGGNRLDVQLASSGTYTVVVEDIGDNDAGSYTVSHLNVSGGPLTTLDDPDGGALASATIATGTMNGVVDWDAFTVTGNAGDRILVTAVTTGGAMNTNTYLYPPGGGSAQIATGADRWDFQLTQGGTYTIVLEDQGFAETGTYAVGCVNLTSGPLTHAGDLDGDGIASDVPRTGTIGQAADVDAFTFSGSVGDRVVVGGIATGGASFNTLLTLYPPGGGPSVNSSSGSDRLEYQLASAGPYTVVVEDVGDDNPGGYTLEYVNVTAGPVTSGGDSDGGWFASGQTHDGTVSPAPDFDVFWFNAQPGDTAKVYCIPTSGALSPVTYLYPPGGGNAVVSTSASNWSYAITGSGRHALLVQHSDLLQTGNYHLGLSGPLTTVDVPAGTPAPSRLALSPAHPNPSSASAAFTLALPRPAPVRLEVYDVRGALVRTLADRTLEAGTHTLAWDGLDGRGGRVASGVYLVRARVGGESLVRRVVRLE